MISLITIPFYHFICNYYYKSQEQSLSIVGLYLLNPIFSHDQLYIVVMSCVKAVFNGLKILILDEERNTNKTSNVVYWEFFQNLYTWKFLVYYSLLSNKINVGQFFMTAREQVNNDSKQWYFPCKHFFKTLPLHARSSCIKDELSPFFLKSELRSLPNMRIDNTPFLVKSSNVENVFLARIYKIILYSETCPL